MLVLTRFFPFLFSSSARSLFSSLHLSAPLGSAHSHVAPSNSSDLHRDLGGDLDDLGGAVQGVAQLQRVSANVVFSSFLSFVVVVVVVVVCVCVCECLQSVLMRTIERPKVASQACPEN